MLLTDWQVIGTAGDTIDGRVIEEGWLDDIAETFDLDNYTPVINAEHMRFYGSFGQVHQLKLGKDKRGRRNVMAVLKPNFRMCELNKEGQKLFTSMELDIDPDGKVMLSGLALTDNPASFGTTAIQLFSTGSSAKMFTQPVALSLFDEPEDEAGHDTTDDKDMENAFARVLKKFFGKSPTDQSNTHPAPDEQDDDDMTPEQFNELKALLTTQQETFTQSISALKPTPETDTTTDDESSDSEADQFAVLAAANAELKQQLADLSAQFKQALGEQAGTHTPDTTGAADEHQDFV